MEELCPLFSVLAVNINLPDFYLGLWGFSAKYLGGKTLVRKDPELLIIKEKKMCLVRLFITQKLKYVKLELTITSWTYYSTLAFTYGIVSSTF